jgi:hypothetical protein
MSMTVREYLDLHKPDQYVLTDRMRVLISEDSLRYLNLDEVNVIKAEETTTGLKLHTDYIADQC